MIGVLFRLSAFRPKEHEGKAVSFLYERTVNFPCLPKRGDQIVLKGPKREWDYYGPPEAYEIAESSWMIVGNDACPVITATITDECWKDQEAFAKMGWQFIERQDISRPA